MILYSSFDFQDRLAASSFSSLLQTVPPALQQEVLRYRRWEDQHASLLGKLLVRRLLDCFGYPDHGLRDMYRDAMGKPRLRAPVDFTISHSGTVVICAMSDECLVGIDIEKIREYDLEDFQYFLRPDELAWLSAGATDQLFCELWTKKESFVKAKGVGLVSGLNLQNIHVDQASCLYRCGSLREQWYYYSVPVAEAYVATLCTQHPGLRLEPVAHNIPVAGSPMPALILQP